MRIDVVQLVAAPELAAPLEPEDQQGAGQLQAELDTAREDLRITIEQMEAANEELKASNEEIRSINEELQASNEELETSKEELQSLNEELNTANNQLQAKVEELEARTDDLNNLLNSTDVATLFLDRALCIRWFTPSMKALLELLPTRHRPADRSLRATVQRRRPARGRAGGARAAAALRHRGGGRSGPLVHPPHRALSNQHDRIDGVVVTFTEITERKHQEQEVEEAQEFAETIVEAVRFPLVVLTPELRVKSANAAFYAAFQVSPRRDGGPAAGAARQPAVGHPGTASAPVDAFCPSEEFADFEIEHDFERIGRRTMLLHARPLDGAQLILLGMVDITERRDGESNGSCSRVSSTIG